MKSSIHYSLACASALVILGALLTSCNQDDPAVQEGHEPIDVILELLQHDDKGLSVTKSITADHIGQSFELAGTQLRILEHWPQAEAVPKTDNDNTKETHAVELAWNVSAADTSDPKESQWIYQTKEDGPSGLLPGLDIQVRVLLPGSHPSTSEQWETSPKDTVQFEHEKRFFSLPDVGSEIFPGWKVKALNTYEHALLEENGDIKESDDTGFANRAIEVILASKDGTIERHLCFLDHPELTKGIHPELLPATRLAGTGASQSRLTACDPINIQGESTNRLLISPNASDPEKLTAFTWDSTGGKFNTIKIDSLPAKVKVGDRSISILQHRNHARSVVEWRRINKKTSKADDKQKIPSALLITWLENEHHQKAVLPIDRATPIRINGQFQTFRYRNAP